MMESNDIMGKDPIICMRTEVPLANFTYKDMLANKKCYNASTCPIKECPGQKGFEKPADRWIKLGCSAIN